MGKNSKTLDKRIKKLGSGGYIGIIIIVFIGVFLLRYQLPSDAYIIHINNDKREIVIVYKSMKVETIQVSKSSIGNLVIGQTLRVKRKDNIELKSNTSEYTGTNFTRGTIKELNKDKTSAVIRDDLSWVVHTLPIKENIRETIKVGDVVLFHAKAKHVMELK